MREFLNKIIILWDFDGVILDSLAVREEGFKTVLRKYPSKEVDELLRFHRINGGLSRYYKFRFFLEEIRGEDPDNKKIEQFSLQFSEIMRKLLISKRNLNQEVLNFIRRNHIKFNMHIVSGSDQEELRFLCGKLNISQYFQSIHGSPTPKNELVKNLLISQQYDVRKCVLIGDSINDFNAAIENGVDFIGYNNETLRKTGTGYIESFY